MSSLGLPKSRWYSERVNQEDAGTMIIQSTLTFYEGGVGYERKLEFRSQDPKENQKSSMLELGMSTRNAGDIVIKFDAFAEYITAIEEGDRLLVRWSDADPSDPPEVYTKTALD